MKLRFFILLFLFALPVLCGADRPNVVLILIDDVGTGWLPPYAERLTEADVEDVIVEDYSRKRNRGRPVDVQKHIEAARQCMPFLSSLAKDGVVFDRAFATANLCAPSRAGVLTGSFQQRWGAYGNKDIDDYGIPADRVVMAEPLKAAGYRCGVVGKWHVGPKQDSLKEEVWLELGEELPVHKYYKGRWKEMRPLLEKNGYSSSVAKGHHPFDRGFDYYFGYNSHGDKYYGSETLWDGWERVPKRPEGEFLTDLFSEKSCAFIEDALKERKPFFLYYAPKTLHGAILPPPEHYAAKFDTGVKFSNEYAGHLLALDEGIRRIYQVLEKYGQAKNTLFIFSSDNGCVNYNVPPHNAPNRGGKGTGWLGGTNVPLIMHKPGLIKPDINREIASLADVMPTVLEAAGIPIPEGIDGRSLVPYLSGKAKSGPRKSLVSCGLHASDWSWFYEGNGERNQKDRRKAPLYAWRIEGDKVLMHITETQAGLYKSLPDGLPSRTMFYDLSTDRHQLKDASGSYPEQVGRFDEGMHQWLDGMAAPISSQQQDYQDLLNIRK